MNFSDFSKTFTSWWVCQAASVDVVGNEILKNGINLILLEDRVLYSAAPFPVDLIEPAVSEQPDQFDFVENTELNLEFALQAIDTLVSADQLHGDLSELPLETSLSIEDSHLATSGSELVVVDTSVEDYQQLVENLVRQSTGERSVEVVYIDAESNGVSQVSDFLGNSKEIFRAIHLVTHGSDGQIQLGDSLLNESTLSTFAKQLETWNSALTENADLVIYGCDVAQTELGEQFVNELAELIGVDVAASDDVTGHTSLSGDWNFEYQVGIIESTTAFSIEVQASWLHDLAIATFNGSSEDGSASRAVAASDGGEFVGVFSTNTIAGSVGADIYYELHTQQDQIDGNPATPIRVNDTLTGDQQWATVAMAANGDMTFVWTSDHSGQLGVYGKIIDSDGTVTKSEFEIDQGNGGHNASIAMDKLGNFVVVWESSGDGDAAGDIYGQVFDAAGNTIDSTFQVNTGEVNGGDTSGYQGRADVAMNEANEFIVSWDNYFDSDTESEIFANKYEFNATTVTSLTGEFLVQGATSTKLQFGSSVDMNDIGDFVVAWTVDSSDTLKAAPFGVGTTATALSTEVHGSTFLANGTLEHSFASINSTTQGDQEHPSVALLNNNVVVFVWEGESTLTPDPDGVYQRAYNFDGTPIDAVERFVSPLADSGVQTTVSIAKYLNTDYVIGFAGILDGTEGYHIVATTAQAIQNVPEGLVYSTAGNGSQGTTAWDPGDAIGFGDPALTFGSPTDGQAYVLFDTPYDLNAIHVVTQETTVDTTIPTVLNVGDVLFSIDEDFTASMPGLGAATDEDILVFRPSSPGNYDLASGIVSILTTLSGTDDILGLTLVQFDTRIGDYDVYAGDILFTSVAPINNDIKLLQMTGGVQSVDILIDGHDVGVDESIMGIELIEQTTTIGGLTLITGSLLLSAEHNETVGEAGLNEVSQLSAGGLSIQDNDIYALEFSTTTLGISGVANATASMFFDASTVGGLSGGPSGDVDAISLVSTLIVNVEESLDVNNGMTVDEGGLLTITNSELLTTDADGAKSDLVYTITSAPAHGTILLSGSPTLTFTQDDIDTNRVSYQHYGTETTTDWFDFSVDDGKGADSTDTFNITINPINDNPVITVNTGMMVNEGQTNAVISAAMLTVVDDDDGPGELIYSILSTPVNGTLYLDTTPLIVGNQFTQTDVALGRLSYDHDGSETALDSFVFSARDGGEDGTLAQVGTFDITINEVNDVPTNLSPGIQLNMDGGNDAYFQAGVGDILAGLNEFTIEMTFSAPYAPATHLFSYETVAGDDVEIALMGDGRLHLEINNVYAGLLTGIDYNTLMDGSIVNFAFSWDNANGAWAVMVDGVVTDSGLGLAVGQTLAGGGQLMFGMDQDSPGGGFLFDEIFSGTFHDIRLWDEVRSAAEILVNKNNKFDTDNVPSGLIANWQMTDLVGGTTIVDLINPGTNDLTLGHASGANFVSSTPTDSLNVDENSVNGTIVGHVVPTDIEYRDDVVSDGLFLNADSSDPDLTTYAADGSWAGNQLGDWTVVSQSVDVKGSDWESSPLGGRPVDLTGLWSGIIEQTVATEIGQEYTIHFALSSNFQGSETDMDMAVNVDGVATNFNFAKQPGWSISNLMWEPQSLTFTATSTSTVIQFESLVTGIQGALVGDVQVLETSTAGNGDFSFDMTDDASGRFVIDSLTGEITVADENGLNFEANTMHTVTIEVTDPAGDTYVENINIYINDVNEAPTLPVNTGMTVSPASTGTVIASSMLNANDVDVSDIPSQLFYTIDSSVNNGSLWLSGVELFNGDSFTQQDINDGNLTYDHNGTVGGDSFDLTLADGGEDGATDVSGTFSIGLGNFEEVITTNSALSVDEGFAATITNSHLQTTDADGTAALVVYTITTAPGEGTLLVSGVPATSFTQADIDAGIVSYAHNGNEASNDGFGFSVDDGFGTATTGSFLITIAPVNDSPNLIDNTGMSISEGDTGVVITTAMLFTDDVDDTAAGLTYTVDRTVANGTLFRGLTQLNDGGTFTQADIDLGLITYHHDGSEPTGDSFDFTVADGGEDGASADSDTFYITISPQNDAPVAGDNVYGVAHGESVNIAIDRGLIYNDVDADGDALAASIATGPLHGFVTINPDGTFTYTHNGTTTTTDSFSYQVTDGLLVDTATVEIHIDSSGFENTDEFLVNQGTVADPIGNIQSTSQTNRLGNAAVDARDNGDYVVTWSSEGADGSNDVFVRLFDFSGTPLTDQIQVNSFESDEQFGSSVAMADDGSFVVTWMSENQDGSGSSVYMRQFNPDGSSDMPSEVRVTEAFYSVGEQRNPTISMNSLGQFTIAWDGANAGGALYDVYARSFDADGTTLGGTIDLTANPVAIEYNPSVVMFDDGSLFTVWDENNQVFVRSVGAGGTLGTVVATPARPEILEIRHSSLDTNADGLVALAYQTKVSDGSGIHWDVHLHVFDPANPVIIENPGQAQVTTADQINPDIALNDDGSILMTWQGQGSGDANDIFVRQFIVETDENGDYIAQATSDESVVTQTTAGTQAGSSIVALDSENYVVVWMGEGVGDTNGVFARQFGNQVSYEASGNVLEDINGDGDLSDATAVEDAEVHLYRDDGDGVIDANDQLIRVTSTDVNGKYTFAGLDEGATYWVVVDSKTIHRSAATNGGYTYDDVWAQQTFGDGGAKFGGLNADVSDDASSLTAAQHVSKIDVFGNVIDVDFGFSFNVVTNTLAGGTQDDDAGANQRSVQGSLRQFMTNANAIDGDNEMRFVPIGAANRTAGTDAWWEIAVSRALPDLTDDGTTIDGRAYLTDGVTLSNSNSSILGYVGNVGVGADGISGTGDEILLNGIDAPELEISDLAGIAKGITVNASNVEISHIAIHGFGQFGFDSGNVFVETAGDYVNIHDNLIGAEADSFTSPPTAAFQSVNIYVDSADNGLIADNLIGFSASTGIQIAGTSDYADDAHGWTITGNEIRSNGLVLAAKDGIDLQYDVVDISIVGNLIAGNSGYGIDSWRGSGGYTIADNTIMGNGIGGDETGGIRLFGSGSEVQHNLISSNTGSGVNIVGDYSNGSTTFTASTGNLVTQNSFSGNSGNSIDLMSSTNDPTILEQGDGVSANGSTSDIGAGNLGLDYPELDYAEFSAGQLQVGGQIDPFANIDRIEFYLANAGTGDDWSGQSYGEGQTYLGTLPVSSLTLNGVTGEFTGILPPPVPGAFDSIPVGQQITSIAIDINNNTSEFGNNITTNVAPTAVDSNVLMDEDSFHIFDKIEFGFIDTPGDTLERVRIDSLPANGTLFLNGVALTVTGIEVSVAQLDANNLTYQPDFNSNGLPLTTFEFSVNDGDSYSAASATLEVHVTPINDQPTGTGESFSTPEDVLLVVDLSSPDNLLTNISDVEGDSLLVTTTPVSAPTKGTLVLGSDGTFTYLPDPNVNGSDSFMYEVVDGKGGSIVVNATVTITPVNDDPVLSDPGVVIVPENTNHVVNLTSTDVEGDSPTYSVAGTGADDAQFDVVGNELVFLSAPDFENPLGFGGNTYFVDVRVDDGNSGFDVRTIEIAVADVIDNPEGFDDVATVDEAGLYTSTTSVLDNDLDRLGDGLVASLIVTPIHGLVNMNADGTFDYQHDGSETTIDHFTYAVFGMDGQVDTAVVTINVNPIQDPTIVNDDGIFEVDPEQTIIVTAAELLANDFDPDSTDLQIVLVDSPADGVAFIDADGNLVFKPNGSFSGLEELEYVVFADGVTSDVATVTFETLVASPDTPLDEEIDPEEEATDDEIAVSDPPPSSEGGSTTDEDIGNNPPNSFADTTADTAESQSSELEIDSNDLDFGSERQQTTYAYTNETNILSQDIALGFGRLTAAVGGAISTFDPVMAGIFWNELDSAKEEFLLKFDLTTPTIVASVTSFLTVGYLAWIIRGGVLLTTFMSSIPAWQAFDPLPVLESAARDDDDDDQSIAQMIDSQ